MTQGQLLKALGWTTIAVGLLLVSAGVRYDEDGVEVNPRKMDDSILEGEFTVVE